jgi:hypothetical protein
MDPVPPTARASLIAAVAALVLTIGGVLVTQVMDPAMTVRVLGILIWVAGLLAVAGLVLGLMSGLKGPGRSGVLISVVTLVLLGLFLGYSGFGASSSGTPAPAATGG